MPQSDFVLSDMSGTAFIAELTASLQALATLNSGNAAPDPSYPHQLWPDTVNGLLKQRNAANSAWITIGVLGAANWGLAPLAGAVFTGAVTLPAGSVVAGYSRLTVGTVVATTSGTSVDFTGIPSSWPRRITLLLAGFSSTGSSPPQVQLGTSSGVETSGYQGSNSFQGASAVTTANFTAAFGIGQSSSNWSAAATIGGRLEINLIGSNTWEADGKFGRSDAAGIYTTAGSKALSGTLDRIRLTTAGGTETCDGGSAILLIEG